MRRVPRGLLENRGHLRHHLDWAGGRAANLLPAWRLEEDHPRIEAARKAVSELELEPIVYRRNSFTNGYVTAGKLGVPTIIFGAGDEAGCHIVDETCPVDQILTACSFYALLESKL